MNTAVHPASQSPNWSPGRKWAAGIFGGLVVTGMVAATLYAAGAAFLVINKVHPKHVELLSVPTYWEAYADDPKRRRQLVGCTSIAGLLIFIVLPGGLVAAGRRPRALHGDARFANAMEVRRAGLLDDPVVASSPGIIVGRYRGRFLMLRGQLSVMLSAPTRSGKGVGVVIPNLLNWPDSVVVLDVKGENYDITAGYRKACGQKVFSYSPFDESARSHRWNPLSSVRSDGLYRVGDLLALGQILFPNDGSGTSSEAFFNDQARNLFMGLGLLLLESPELPRTIGEMLRQSSGQGRTLKDHLEALLADRLAGPMPLTSECTDALQRLLSNSENTLSSIVATFNAPLTIFADAIVDAATSGDDFDLQDVRRQRMSVYVRIPPNRLASARPLLNLLFSQLVSLNTRQLPSKQQAQGLQCLLVQDEFATLGRISVLTAAAAYLPGYNLRLLTVVQAMSQLDAIYGEREARTFATNHGLQILYAPREQRDADEYSAMLGHFTQVAVSRGRSRSVGQTGRDSISRNESDQRRSLLLPQEFKELGSEREVVILENCKPILADKIRYQLSTDFTERLKPAPEVPGMDMDLHQARVQQRWRYLDDELASEESLQVDHLAGMPAISSKDLETPAKMGTAVDTFFDRLKVPQRGATGGAIQEVAEVDQSPVPDEFPFPGTNTLEPAEHV